MSCLAQKFASIVNAESSSSSEAVAHVKGVCSAEDMFNFLQWALGYGEVIGFHVRQLILFIAEKKRESRINERMYILFSCRHID